MIRHLSIRNYALIDHLEVDFEEGLTVITGETGSGKSIILGALGLALGERAQHNTLRDPEQKCIVEVTFRLQEDHKALFIEHDLDWESDTIVRREITPSGKSRSFVNDTPVTLQILKALGNTLVDIHSQHQNQLLKSKQFRYDFVDALAGTLELRSDFRRSYHALNQAQKELETCRQKIAEASRDKDYNEFQLNELEALNLDDLNQNDLENEVGLLENSESVIEVLNSLSYALEDDEKSVNAQLDATVRQLERLSGKVSSIDEIHERLNAVLLELKDIHYEVSSISGDIEINPARLEQLRNTLDELYRIQQKHGANSVEELLHIQQNLASSVTSTEDLEKEAECWQAEINRLTTICESQASELAAQRQNASSQIESNLESFLIALDLVNASISISWSDTEGLHENGKGQLQLLFSANRGGNLSPIELVASGGEFSRVMLAIKSALSEALKLPALILDEVDTGVSGEVALKVGKVMAFMANNMQVMAISHLPQIAGKARHHFKVYKKVEGDSTQTFMHKLDADQRVDEIAEMISGKALNDAAKESARQLLKVKG